MFKRTKHISTDQGNHRLLLEMLCSRSCLAKLGVLSHYSKERIKVVFHSVRTSVRAQSCCLRPHPVIQLARCRDHAGKNSRFRVAMKINAANTLDVRQVQKRQLVMNLRRSLSMFATSVVRVCGIRIARAGPTSSALGFQLSFRGQLRVSIQLISRFDFSVVRLLVATTWLGRGCVARVKVLVVMPVVAVLSVRSSACVLPESSTSAANARVPHAPRAAA